MIQQPRQALALLAALIAIPYTLAGCGNAATQMDPPNDERGVGGYFPLEEGAYWRYTGDTEYELRVQGDTTIAGRRYIRLLENNGAGVRYLRWYRDRLYTTLPDNLQIELIAFAPDEPYGWWETEYEEAGIVVYTYYEIQTNDTTVTVLGREYQNVQHVEEREYRTNPDNGAWEQRTIRQHYYARGVGPIDLETAQHGHLLLREYGVE